MTLVWMVLAWLAGIGVSTNLPLPWWAWSVLTALPIPALFIWKLRTARLIVVAAILFSLGGLRNSLVPPQGSELATFNGVGFVTVEGIIDDAPIVRDAQINLRVRAQKIQVRDEDEQPVAGVMLVQTPNVGTFRYGDPVRVQGQIVTPPESGDFSYRDYLAQDGIYSLMQYAQVEVFGPRQGSPIRATMLDFRSYAYSVIQRLLPDPQSSLLAGILLGIGSGISPDVLSAFNTVGATHIIVISGSNLAILAGLLLSVTGRFLNKNFSAAATIAGIILYAIFVGGDPAVMRAAVMITLGLIAARLGRETYGLASLSFAALLLTAIDPGALSDISFQLSFMATLGLIIYTEPLQTLFDSALSRVFSADTAKKITGAAADSFIVTIAAQITTDPLIAYHFGRFSLVSLPVNLLIVPVQSYIMVLGGLGVLAAMLFWPLGQVLAWGSWLFLSFTLIAVRFFANLPFASADAGRISFLELAALYGLIFGVTWILMKPEAERTAWFDSVKRAFSVKALGGAGLLSVALLFTVAFSLPDSRLHVTFIDVGNGTATLIETPSGRHILIDAGGGGRRLSTGLGDEMPFWDRRIDLAVITQPTLAHAGALSTALERYHVDAVVTNGRHGSSDLSTALWESLQQQGAQEIAAVPGMTIQIGDGAALTVLQSDLNGDADPTTPGDPVVLILTYGDLRVLLCSDLSSEAEQALLASGENLDATVLVVPRGGHRANTNDDFLSAVTPQISIIAPTSNDLPHAETLARLDAVGSAIYRVDEMGTIHLTSDGKHMWITTEKH